MADEVRFACALPADELLFRSLIGREELGRLPQTRVELLRPSVLPPLQAEALLGKPASVVLQLDHGRQRHLHGLVTQFERGGVASRNDIYRIELRPWLWLLTLASDFRVFQDQTALQILDTVFAAYGSAGRVDKRIAATLSSRPYTVQYRETDFNFVCRLMEDEGIHYYFRHEARQHTLVLCEGPSGHEPIEGGALAWSARQGGKTSREDVVLEWSRKHSLQSAGYSHTDFAAEAPGSSLLARAERPSPHAEGNRREVFDYPGGHDDLSMAGDTAARLRSGRDRAQRQVDRFESQHCVATGLTPFRGLAAGSTFDFREHDDAGAYLVTATVTELSWRGNESNPDKAPDQPLCSFTCRFHAVPKSVAFVPLAVAARAVARGPETALVVGPAGDEIHTDAFGRVKLQFHWDRVGAKNDRSSCWVRVSQPWAGKGFGALALPRVGDEVVVDFLDGNPDRPLVTGRVYNADNMPPWALPAQAAVSGIKTRSSKDGSAATANELRFDDSRGAEYLWLQAERDYHQWVRQDAYQTVRGALWSEVGKSAFHRTGEDLSLAVGRQASIAVAADTHASLDADLILGVGGALHLSAAEAIAVRGAAGVALGVGEGLDVDVGTTLRMTAGAALHLKAEHLVLDGGLQLTLKAGGSFITLGPEGVSIQGALVKLNSGGAAASASAAARASPAAPRRPGEARENQDPLAG